MNIVLTGLRGSGKTKLGKLLSKKLNFKFIDVDTEIEKQEKLDISEIIKKESWDYFRSLENKILKTFLNEKNTVISTGGGVILKKENIEILKKLGTIIYLEVDPKICAKRIVNSKNKRPKLTNEKTIREELQLLDKKRKHVYKESADVIFKRSEDIELDLKKLNKMIKLLPRL